MTVSWGNFRTTPAGWFRKAHSGRRGDRLKPTVVVVVVVVVPFETLGTACLAAGRPLQILDLPAQACNISSRDGAISAMRTIGVNGRKESRGMPRPEPATGACTHSCSLTRLAVCANTL